MPHSIFPIDLHSHSTASDGHLSPSELVERALSRGLTMLALTDHDTVAGVKEAKTASQHSPLRLITGVEISAMFNDKPFHFTALNIDENNPDLLALLQRQALFREQRAQEIGEKLAQKGISEAYAIAKSLAKGEITRAHYAQALIQCGAVSNVEQAFRRYLSSGKPAYVKPQWCSMEEAIEVTHRAGGLICVAHPLRYKLTNRWILRLVEAFKAAGGDGLEVAGCGQDPLQRQMLARWAQQFSLLGSVGSDFHYPQPWLDLGKSLALESGVQPIWDAFSCNEAV